LPSLNSDSRSKVIKKVIDEYFVDNFLGAKIPNFGRKSKRGRQNFIQDRLNPAFK